MEHFVCKLLNIVIDYENETEVINYATQLSKLKNKEFLCIVVVINKSQLESFDEFINSLENLNIDFKVYFPSKNLGYLNGAIFGYECYIKETGSTPSWILISNTDISYIDDSFFENFSHNKYEDDIWVVGPSVYSPMTKSYSNPQYKERYSHQLLDRNIFIFSHPILAYLFVQGSKIKSRYFKRNKKSSCYVFSVHGCFFFIKNELANYLVNNPYKAILYSEEAYISNIVYKIGKKSFYDSSLEIIHHENTVTKLIGIKQRSKYIVDSLNVIKDEFYN